MSQSLVTGEISGTVTDPSLALVPEAGIKLKSLDTDATLETNSSSAGSYRFSLLKPGRYELSAEKAGFADLVRQVTVQVGQITTVDIALRIAKGAETIEVSVQACRSSFPRPIKAHGFPRQRSKTCQVPATISPTSRKPHPVWL